MTTGIIHSGYDLDIEYLIVAGGGGGGGRHAGGGGAGGLVYGSTTIDTSTQTYAIVIGDGGAGGTVAGSNSTPGVNGSDSTALGVTATGGGYGGAWNSSFPAGNAGGSGGGSCNSTNAAGSQGNVGGTGYTGSPYNHGGGGGAGTVGVNGSTITGDGGDGLYYGDKFGLTIGDSGYLAGGGGGGSHTPHTAPTSTGGLGGGGNEGTNAGTVNTGGGGGGGSLAVGGNGYGGAGGSGIVAIRYIGHQKAIGGTVTSANGYTIHTFTSDENFYLSTGTTWEFWYKKNSNNSATDNIICGKENLFLMNDKAGDLDVAIYTDTWGWLDTGYNISEGTIYHIVAIYDGTRIKVYVNGSIEYDEAKSGGALNYNDNIYKFNSRGATESTITDPGNHTMYIFRIYDRVLHPSEIRANYNRDKDLFGV